jgi:hypothetical protein
VKPEQHKFVWNVLDKRSGQIDKLMGSTEMQLNFLQSVQPCEVTAGSWSAERKFRLELKKNGSPKLRGILHCRLQFMQLSNDESIRNQQDMYRIMGMGESGADDDFNDEGACVKTEPFEIPQYHVESDDLLVNSAKNEPKNGGKLEHFTKKSVSQKSIPVSYLTPEEKARFQNRIKKRIKLSRYCTSSAHTNLSAQLPSCIGIFLFLLFRKKINILRLRSYRMGGEDNNTFKLQYDLCNYKLSKDIADKRQNFKLAE